MVEFSQQQRTETPTDNIPVTASWCIKGGREVTPVRVVLRVSTLLSCMEDEFLRWFGHVFTV